ncbi:MAG: hypothetical protein ACRCYO_16870 [Bacteroidia bacterium]
MTRIESETVATERSQNRIFTFLSDFNNFQALMPEQITNWQSTSDTCRFTINGMAQIGMRIASKEADSKIHIVSDGKNPFEFTMDVLITATSDQSANGQLIFEGDINPFIRAMVESPLRSFVNVLAKKMVDIPAA